MADEGSRHPHALYRFYDAADVLLYIGITVHLPARLSRHRDEKEWWRSVARMTVEQFPDRDAVLAAEKAAIRIERPLHNVQHNGALRLQRPVAEIGIVGRTSSDERGLAWTFRSRHGRERTTPLWLYWEVHGDPITDDYYIDEIDAVDLWREWLRRYPFDERSEALFGIGSFAISWFVEGDGTFESAPFQDHRVKPDSDFLTHYSVPRNAASGEVLQWSRLPVIDKIWRTSDLPAISATKGGFIQEATGWKPSPLQSYVDVYRLGRLAGLYLPDRSARREVAVS